MTNSYDVIIIGAGHNGLVAAARLAKEGRRVLVLERRAEPGGLAAGEEFHHGYRTLGVLTDTTSLRRAVIDGLGLERRGLRLREAPAVLIPQEKGPGLLLHRDPAKAGPELSRRSSKDAAAYAETRAFLARIAPAVGSLLESRPAMLAGDLGGDWGRLLKTGLALRLLGEKTLLELLRVGPMCVADWLNERFEDDLLKAGLAGLAVRGTWMGPWSAGTVATLLLKECFADKEVVGGPAALAKALVEAARGLGVEIRLSAPVAQVRVVAGKAVGVALEDGSEIGAAVVASSTDPRRTLLGLLAPADLPDSLEREIRAFKARGVAAKVNLALSGPLEFASRPGEPIEAARTGERIDDVERAYDAVKYRRFSEAPVLDIRVPTVSEEGLAPRGHHVAEILVHYAPYDLAGGWTDEARRRLGETVLGRLERYAPQVRKRLVGMQVLTPADLESRYGLSGGHLYHGEHALDQLYFMRPTPSCARYATPIEGLYLCGSGSHPGGGITGAPGWLAAKEILAA